MKAMKWLSMLLAGCLTMIVSACGNNDSFIAEGTVDGLGTRNMRAVYTTDGGVQSLNVTAVDSKFRFEGNSPKETVVELYTNTRTLIGRFVAKNGDALDVALKLDDPLYLKSSGNKTGGKLADFLKENRTDTGDLNAAIDKYVTANPKAPLSGILLSYYYNQTADPERAVELIGMLDGVALPGFMKADRIMLERSIAETASVPSIKLLTNRDSLATMKVADKGKTLIVLDPETTLEDSTVTALDTISKLKDVTINYLRLSPDTFHLSANTARLPKKTNVFMAPGGPARADMKAFAISCLPLYIVSDTTATQIYRTTSLDDLIEYFYN